jgi:glycosyltransferase involved in cell wall biosynthesis
VYPPVNVHAGYLSESVEDFYLVVGQLVDYKRMDLAIAACNHLGRRLHVVGEGEQYGRLRKLAGPTIHFCGALSDKDLQDQYARCRALLFPGEEDFGIVPVEALSFGRPVIAYGRGGATETVKGLHVGSQEAPENSTGIFFPVQSVDSLVEALRRFEAVEHKFRPSLIKRHADRFAPEHFEQHFRLFLAEKWEEFHNGSIES